MGKPTEDRADPPTWAAWLDAPGPQADPWWLGWLHLLAVAIVCLCVAYILGRLGLPPYLP